MNMKFFQPARESVTFVALSFILISTTSFAISKRFATPVAEPVVKKNVLGVEEGFLPPAPFLIDNFSVPIISAQAVLAYDIDSGIALFEKNPDAPLLPASTTKIITALVSLDYFGLETILKVNGDFIDGQKMELIAGERILVDDLLHGLLIASANDAAQVLANNYPGGTDNFVVAMNAKARQLGMSNSFFVNPSGLDAEGQVSTARDLVRISNYAMRNPYFAQIVGTKETLVKSTDGRIIHKLTNINKLLGEVPGVLGVKTGWTENARENLVTYVERDGRRVMIAVLGSQDRFGETEELIDWIFKNYEWEEVSPPAAY